MKEAVCLIIGAVFNIAAIVAQASGENKVAEVIALISPEANIIVVSVLFFFGYTSRRRISRLNRRGKYDLTAYRGLSQSSTDRVFCIGGLRPGDGSLVAEDLKGVKVSALSALYIWKGAAWNGVQGDKFFYAPPAITIDTRTGTVYVVCPSNWPEGVELELTVTTLKTPNEAA